MDPIKKGDITESRGFRALFELKDLYPEFVLHARRSSPEMDARGIDALVNIRLSRRGRNSAMSVPIEFKSSPWGVAKWKVAHSDLHRAGVLIFHIPETMSPRKLRRLMYRALDRVRKNSRDGTLYHSMFQRLFRGGSKNLWKNIALIKKKRERDKK